MKLSPESVKSLQISLGLLCFVFIVTLIYELSRGYTLVGYLEDGEPPHQKPLSEYQGKPDIRPISEYTAIIERPLFSDDRRPYVPPEQPVPMPIADNKPGINPKNTDDYLLTAVIITRDDRIALLQSNRGKAITKLGVGETIAGWTLAAVEPHEVTLTRGSDKKTLALEVIKSPVQAPGTGHGNRASRAQDNTAEVTIVTPDEKADNREDQQPETENDSVKTPN